MIVALAAKRMQVALHTHVSAEQDLAQVPLPYQFGYVRGTNLVTRISISDVTGIVDTHVYTGARNGAQAGVRQSIAQMADDNAVRRHALFPQQRDLLQREFSKVSCMGHDAYCPFAIAHGPRLETHVPVPG